MEMRERKNTFYKKMWLCIVLIIICFIGCGNTEESGNANTSGKDAIMESEVAVYFSDVYRNAYIESNKIEIVDFKKKNTSLDKLISKFDGEVIPIKEEPAFGTNYYARTNNSTDLYYVGDMKDNRPHGTGCIYKVISPSYTGIFHGNNTVAYLMKVYDGEFEKGKFEGYGRKYYSVESIIDVEDEYGMRYEYARLLEFYVSLTNDIQDNIFLSLSPVIYEGEFKNGEYSGEGNYYEYVLESTGLLRIDVASGEFKKGEVTECTVYNGARLIYEGEMKDWEYHGKGTAYYQNGEKRYEGEWFKGKYDGKGTLYNEDGSVKYKGKWNFGDYDN